MSIVRFENVGLRYGTGPEVLKDLNLTLETGSFNFLTGASGAGKTSLMRMLFLALKPTRGMISLFGQNTSALRRSKVPDVRRRIGVVFQTSSLIRTSSPPCSSPHNSILHPFSDCLGG